MTSLRPTHSRQPSGGRWEPTISSPPPPAAFVKHYEPGDLTAELVKARLMVEAAEATGVRVPGVLEADTGSGTIRYEHIDCPTSLLDLMSSRRVTMADVLARVEQAGAVLAALHRVLPVDGFPRHRRSGRFDRELGPEREPGDSRLVLQHGDYGYSNVRFTPTGELVVIDPSPNRYVSVDPLNVDHPELDLALIASNFLGRTVRPVAMGRTVGHGPELFAALITGYESQGPPIDRKRLRAYTAATVISFAAWCQRGRPQVLVPLARLLERNMP
jgi:hypothetical protein